MLLSARIEAKRMASRPLASVPKPTSLVYAGFSPTKSSRDCGASAAGIGKVRGASPLPVDVRSQLSHALTKHTTLAVWLAPSGE